MRMGVVGNREGFSYMQVRHELDKFPEIDTIITGGCQGVDRHAMRYAKEKGICLVVYYPRLSLGSPKCYFKRNTQIVKHSEKIIAFNKKEHSGTQNTINTAKRLNKPIKIIT